MQDLDELTLEVTWHSPELQTRVQNFYHKSSHVEEMKQSLTVSEAVGPPESFTVCCHLSESFFSMLSLVRIVLRYVVTCPKVLMFFISDRFKKYM